MGIIDKLFGKKKVEKETQTSANCDLCETTIVQVTNAHQVSSEKMQNLVKNGFSIYRKLSSGPVAKLIQSHANDEIALRNLESGWVRQVMTDKTSWTCCENCSQILNNFKASSKSTYEFINPQVFSGFPLKLLKYLFVHIPEKDLESSQVSNEFIGYLCDTAGASDKEIFKQANISYVKESNAGDIVQQIQKVPDWVYEQIGSFYPEVEKNRERYPFVVRTFNSELQGRFGLIVFIYDVLLK